MPETEDPKTAVKAELERIEEDCIHSGKSHFNASDRWTAYHMWLGVPSVILSAVAGAAFFKNYPDVAGIMSSIVAILTALSTFLKPSERSSAHKSSGDQYLSLRNDSRILRTIKLNTASDEQTAIASMDEITKRRNELNKASPQFRTRDFQRAKKGIDAGEAKHRVDGEVA